MLGFYPLSGAPLSDDGVLAGGGMSLTGTPPPAYFNVAYSFTPTRTGGTAPFVYSILTGALPPGLTLNTSTGVISGTPTNAFDPATLFVSGDRGGWWDISDLSKVWQDSAGTVAGVVGQPVGRITDKSLVGNHLIQATTANKPILRQDASNYYYLEFDGVNDYLNAALGANVMLFPSTRVSAVSHVATGTIIRGANDSQLLFTNPEVRMFNGTQLPGPSFVANTQYVFTEKWDHPGNSSLAKENDAYFSGLTGSPQSDAIGIGDNTVGGRPSTTRHYGFVWINRALTVAEIADCRTHFASKQGRTL